MYRLTTQARLSSTQGQPQGATPRTFHVITNKNVQAGESITKACVRTSVALTKTSTTLKGVYTFKINKTKLLNLGRR